MKRANSIITQLLNQCLLASTISSTPAPKNLNHRTSKLENMVSLTNLNDQRSLTSWEYDLKNTVLA